MQGASWSYKRCLAKYGFSSVLTNGFVGLDSGVSSIHEKGRIRKEDIGYQFCGAVFSSRRICHFIYNTHIMIETKTLFELLALL